MIAKEKTYLDVPYADKATAKEYGAKWDWGKKLWYAPQGTDLSQFKQWFPTRETSQLSPQEEFAITLKDFGFDLQELPTMDGTIQRVALVDDKRGQKSGAYGAYLDGRPAGWADNFRTGERITWTYSKGSKLSQEDREKLVEDHIQKSVEREARRKEEQNFAAQKSLKELHDCHLASNNHPYLVAKGIQAYDIYESGTGNTLLVPVFNMDNELRGTQKIHVNGEKYFEKGMEKKACFHVVGGSAGKIPKDNVLNEIILCEGYATGVSLHLATQKPVAVAFDAGNLEHVAKKFREKFPKAKITICADNDHTKSHNIGVEKAKQAAVAVGGHVRIPLFNKEELAKGLTDFNDLHRSRGLKSVKQQISKGLSKERSL